MVGYVCIFMMEHWFDQYIRSDIGEVDFAYCKAIHTAGVENLKLTACTEVSWSTVVHAFTQNWLDQYFWQSAA